MGFAQDQGLYAPAPPADAAFVRVLNAAASPVSPTVGTLTFEPLDYGGVSAYEVVSQGEQPVSAGELSADVSLEAGYFYTLVMGDTVQTLQDPALSNRAKTLLVLYNLSGEPVNLQTADGSTAVIPDVTSGELGSIEVNPISVAFGAFSGDAALQAFDEVALERGAAYSTFVLPDGSAAFSQNTTATE